MSSAGISPPRPSVFISYASEDRAAARALREALNAAGLEVWYDENELGGGDAWDQKIRRQIRDCDYFMPVVSASTERRKEGYFRREWRLATERSLDMADDVLFLLPVTIDDTPELSARVPEKFLTVQWLRLPGGHRTPALDALVQRLVAGDHSPATTRPPLLPRPPVGSSSARSPGGAAGTSAGPAGEHHRHIPPMPPFPHAPETGGVGAWLRFCAEILWWAISAAWLLFTRLPKWLRVVLTIWFVFFLISTCNDNSGRPRRKSNEGPPASPRDTEQAVAAAIENVAGALAQGAKDKDWDKFGEDLARRFGKSTRPRPKAAPGEITFVNRVTLLPFVSRGHDAAVERFAQGVFAACYGRFVVMRPDDAGIAAPIRREPTDEAITKAGRDAQSEFVLGFRISNTADGANAVSVRLLRSSDGTVVWNGDFPVAGSDARAIGEQVADAVMAAVK